MSETCDIILRKLNSSKLEVNRSSPNLNTKSDDEDNEVNNYQVLKTATDDVTQSISKSHETISITFSMQEDAELGGNTSSQSKQTSVTTSLSASFKQLSRRESSLENLAEDGIDLQINASASDNSFAIFVQKSNVNDCIRDFTRKTESPSRFRRTMYSLLSCCSTKSRRSPLMAKVECNVAEAQDESDSDKGANQILSHRSRDKDHVGLNCLKLRKFFDMLDETDTAVKRVQPTRHILPSVPYRDGDKTDSPCRKGGDNPQSENGGANLARPVLLGPIKLTDQGKKCFIIDLDETLVHSSFKMVDKADFKVGVDIEGTVHTVYVLKRPYVDVFLQKMGRIFECVLFTASLAKYADPVTDFLDKMRVFRWRLFRESCVFHRGNYVKDLSMLGRPADQVLILDNSPASYMFHPDSAVQITSWFDDPKDTALLDLIPYLEALALAPSVPPFLASQKPPARATVPVSIMLPLAVVAAASSTAPSTHSKYSLIASVSPTTMTMTTTTTNVDEDGLVSPDSLTNCALQLPFSRGWGPLSSAVTKSLSSLACDSSNLGLANRAITRSEGLLTTAVGSRQLLCVATLARTRLSRSVSALAVQLTVRERRPTTAHSSPTLALSVRAPPTLAVACSNVPRSASVSLTTSRQPAQSAPRSRSFQGCPSH